PAVGRFDVGGADEGVGEPAVLLAHVVLLVHASGELDHFGRDFEELGIEAAEQRYRPFGEAGVLYHQALVLDQREAGFGRGPGRAVADQRLALGVVDDDVAGAQLLLVVAGAADGDRARVVEAVAERHVAAGDLTDRAFHELFAEDGDDAGERAHPAQALGAERGGAPAHRFRPGEAADDGGNRLGEHGLDRPARLFDDGEIHPTTVFELVLGETGLGQEAFERLRRRGGARALGLLAHRLRRLRQIAGDQRQAARGGPDGDLADRNAGG